MVSDDDPISDRQLAFWVHTTRAQLIRQQLTKGQTLSDNVTQLLPCIEVEQIDASMDPSIHSNCYIVQSKLKLPKPLEAVDSDMILKVSTPKLGSIPFTMLPEAAMPYSEYNPFGKRTVKAFLKQGYIILKNTPYIEKISVTMVAENPEEASNFSTCEGTPCFTYDSDYPISAHMIDTLKRLIIDTHFKFLLKPISDNTNNAAFNIEDNTAK